MQPIFVVDDEKMITSLLDRALSGAGFTVEVFHDAERALDAIPNRKPFLVLLDLHLPGMNGLEALERLRTLSPETEVLMISGHGTIDVAVEAMKAGATDFLSKPVQLPEVISRVSRVYETRKLRTEVAQLRDKRRSDFFAGLHRGESPAMAQLYRTCDQIAQFPDIIALITGASGTGKEMVAQYLHYQSPFKGGPVVAINCAAIPHELIEAELFGYAPGAFTDARAEGKEGKIEAALGGTLFLDEIGELPPSAQVKLLRFLQDRSFTPIGESMPRHIDCNIIAATNRDPEKMVAAGEFREDLYYRINVVRLHLPSLAERQEDIMSFAEIFLAQFRRAMGRPFEGFDESAWRKLLHHSWPGNLRELRNVIERACLLSAGPMLTASDLLISAGEVAAETGAGLVFPRQPMSLDKAMAIYARQVLEALEGNKSEAARRLGISRNRLKRILAEN